ncbi:MAG: OsmC family protein [Rhodospirillales bacterium]|nr:OsmC family protein [Rhodospirillales bacterium]
MAALREKMLVNLALDGTCPTHTETRVRVGRHAVTIDEPLAAGGTDLAPTPLGTLLASLIGCTNVILHKIAARDGVDIADMAVAVNATLDRRGTSLREEIDIPFPDIALRIAFATTASEAAVARLRADLGRFCPVSKILRQAGTRIAEEWQVTHR